MKRSFAVAALAGALALAPLGSAQAATAQPAAPVAGCVEFPIGAPGGCDFIQNILQLLSLGSSTLSADPTAP
ncbi:hypothetical protein [Nocardia caishijiensis]|uniref:hypothetical protein n=1 Tax=Nocardia caishijiensis TaxID=184756 RepID=UPI000ABB64A0|nr:hypothetical protein [Nocardia caishijiensis]